MARDYSKYKITIPYLQIGEYKVITPEGLSELLQDAWTHPNNVKRNDEFFSKYECVDFKNEKGQIVSRFTLKEK